MKVLPSTVSDLLDTWELSIMVLFSLSLQVFLTLMGLKRKYSSKNWVRLLLLFAYLSANWVATVSLGILFSMGGRYGGNFLESITAMKAFWAPFLLLHLGGPDTITAYSMEDNDLWLRHFINLLGLVGIAFYVFLQAWQPTGLNYVAIPMFVVGIIKYGERTWVLRSASSQHLRDQLLSAPHLSPNAVRFRDRRSGFPIRITVGGGDSEGTDHTNNPTEQGPPFSDLHMLHIAYCFFQRYKLLFADLVMSSYDLIRSLHYFEKFDSVSAFKVIELELGFMYDFFYTKASVIFSQCGLFLRFTNLSSIALAIATFWMNDNHRYPLPDLYLTYSLLFGALGIEIYLCFLFLCSDLTVIWLTQSSSSLAPLTFNAISRIGWSFKKRRWSNSVPQYNLITQCLKDMRNEYCKFLSFFDITKIMSSRRRISDELKTRIYEQLKLKLELDEESRRLPGWILRKCNCFDQLGWSVELDLDRSILLWHIATDLCYYSDHEVVESSNNSSVREDSKSLSNFLTYLLAYRHSLFPNGMAHIRFRAIVDEAIDFLREESITTAVDACKSMLEVDSNSRDHLPTNNVEEGEENGVSSLFYHGCKLAFELQELGDGDRWEIISHVWVEMLANISCECKWYDHIEQLGHGGDLLTHVWLLMHHLGYIK